MGPDQPGAQTGIGQIPTCARCPATWPNRVVALLRLDIKYHLEKVVAVLNEIQNAN